MAKVAKFAKATKGWDGRNSENVRLLIDETFATGTYTVSIASGWVAPPDGVTAEIAPGVSASDVGTHDAALIPISEIPALRETHEIVPAIAVVADATCAIAMRTPVRPDEIDATPIRLLDAGGTAEMLARATLRPFYGIEPTGWVRDAADPDAARAEVVIVEGAEALREPEGGFSEDLCRAWFILTAQPVVTHVLMTPRDADPAQRQAVLDLLDRAREEGVARRREWRPGYAEREGIVSSGAGAFWSAQRLALEDADRQALLTLLREGSSGTSGSSPLNVQFYEGANSV
jgi:predicted solute-binding protein